jgi:acetyltransferase
MTKPLETAQAMSKLHHLGKPVLASFMGGDKLTEGISCLSKSNIPNFPYPDEAASAFGILYSHQEDLKALYETPAVRDEDNDLQAVLKRVDAVEKIIELAQREQRSVLTEFESKEILTIYGIPTVKTIVCKTKEEAALHAEKMGFPVVVKLHSDTITHKSDVGGVKLNLQSKQDVLEAYETILANVKKLHSEKDFGGVTVQQMISLKGTEILLGSIVDEQFGPIVMFGTGGVLVEVFKDRALGMPPLNATLAKQMIEKTKIHEALKGARGKKSIDFSQLEKIMINFSKLIVEHPKILECDINPLLASPEKIIALDARFVIALNKNQIVQSAIRPYPTEYIQSVQLQDLSFALIRPIRPEDEPKISALHKELSESTIRKRFFEFISLEERTAHERLLQICAIDYENEMRFVAVDLKKEVVGVISYHKLPNSNIADFKLVIVDRMQNKGLGKLLLTHLIAVAKKEGVSKLIGTILDENTVLLNICEKLHFTAERSKTEKKIIHVTVNLLH